MGIRFIWPILFVLFGAGIGGFLAGIDRKITARLQGRKGPSVWQPFYDVFKLFRKQEVIVNSMQEFLICGFFLFIVFTGALFFWGGDILLVFFSLTLAGIFLMMSACSANSPFSAMGAQRELMQTMTYEPMVLMAAIGFYVCNGSFAISDIVRAPLPSILYLPGVFVGFVYILTIKLRKSPFDISTSHHAHQEMVKGITTELSGPVLALVELSHWYENVFLLGVVALFFVSSSWWSWILAVVVCILCYLFEILIDNTFARVKWQEMLKTSWTVTLIAGGLNIMIIILIL